MTNSFMTSPLDASRRVLLATSLSYVVVILDTSIVNVALEPIAVALHADVSGLQWVVNAYTLAFASLLLSGGTLGDRFGAKNVYLSGLLLFGLASALCGMATSLPMLITARVIQGVGAAMLVPASLSLINRAFPVAHQRAKAIALWAGCGGIAMAAGPLLGGLLIAALGWRSLFLVNVPVVCLGIGLAMRIMVKPDAVSTQKKPQDFLGQALAMVALGSTVGVLIEGARLGWHDTWVQLGVLLAVVAWLLFITVERRRPQPMLPLDLFRSPVFSASVFVSMVSGWVFYGLFFLLSLYFQQTRGWPPLETGLGFLPLTALVALGSFVSGRLSQFISPLWLVSGCCVLYAAGFLGLLALADAPPYWRIALCFPAVGLAAGVMTPVATSVMMSHADKARSGIAAGVLNASRQTGSALGVAVFGGLLAAVQPQTDGIRLAVCVAVVLSLTAGVFWVMALKRAR